MPLLAAIVTGLLLISQHIVYSLLAAKQQIRSNSRMYTEAQLHNLYIPLKVLLATGKIKYYAFKEKYSNYGSFIEVLIEEPDTKDDYLVKIMTEHNRKVYEHILANLDLVGDSVMAEKISSLLAHYNVLFGVVEYQAIEDSSDLLGKYTFPGGIHESVESYIKVLESKK